MPRFRSTLSGITLGVTAWTLLRIPFAHAELPLPPKPPVAGPPNAGRRTPPDTNDTEVTSDTALQLYEVRSPSGQSLLVRRRFLTTFGVQSYDLTSAASRACIKASTCGPEFNFRSRLRYDADYGASANEANPLTPSSYVPGFERGPVDLMFAYVEGRRLLRGHLDFRVGRMLQVDTMGYAALDGLEVRVHSPYHIGAQASFGLEVRGGFPLSSPRYERDGLWRGSRSSLDTSYWASFVEPTPGRVAGIALETEGLRTIHARLSYRRVDSFGDISTSPYETYGVSRRDFGARVAEERVGASANWSPLEALGTKVGAVMDLTMQRATLLFASLDAYPSRSVTLGVDYDFTRPWFSGDAIWNFFQPQPMHHLGARTHVTLSRHWSLGLGSFARVVQDIDDGSRSTSSGTTSDPDPLAAAARASGPQSAVYVGGDFSAKHTFTRGNVGVRSDLSSGANGSRYGGDAFGMYTFEKRFLLSGRLSLWRWVDVAKPDRSASSVGYVAGLGYQLGPRQRTQLEFEHNMNALVGNRYRVMLTLAMAVGP